MTWYVLCVAPSSEQSVAKRAADRGFESYCPMMRTFDTKKPSIEVTRPLMPGYLFINDPLFDIFAPDYFEGDDVNSLPPNVYRGYVADCARPAPAPIRGCRGFVLWEGAPARVRASRELSDGTIIPGVIEDLRQREDRGGFNFTGRSENGRYVLPKWIRRGRRAEMIGGPFAGFFGVILKTINSKMIRILAFIFDRETPMDIPIEWVQAV